MSVKITQGLIEGRQPFGPGLLLHLRWPDFDPTCVPGQFFLVRCTPSSDIWDPYLRRVLFPTVIAPQHLALWLSDVRDRGLTWLAAQPEGTPVDLLGPGGHGFDLPTSPGNVLILAQDDGIGPLWPVMQQAIAIGHQVTLAIGVPHGDLAVPLSLVPVAVEYRIATIDGSAGICGSAITLLSGLERWPDRIYAALPRRDWPRLRAWIESWRFALEKGFAQMLVQTDMLCGTGACLACVIERSNGRLTRTCVHGPVLDLTWLT
jgi:dihydroorotate dehydrogenase electron transfer subunit